MDPQKRPNRWLAIGLAVAAAACLVTATFTQKWLVNGNVYEQIDFGLRDMSQCGSAFGESECDRYSNADFVDHMKEFSAAAERNTSSAFSPMGWATFVACLLAALGLALAALIALANKRPDLPI